MRRDPKEVFTQMMKDVIQKWRDKKEYQPPEEYILGHLAHCCRVRDSGKHGIALVLDQYGSSDRFDYDKREVKPEDRDYEALYRKALVSALDHIIFMANIRKREILELQHIKQERRKCLKNPT